jgi:ankyrin repeat protein
MRYSGLTIAACTLLLAAPLPGFAQLSSQTGAPNQNNIQPRGPTPDIAPPALPGASGAPGLATAAPVQKPISGDPTTALFTAVNAGDYNAAQDAVSRGADPNAQNALGETPLDLSIALNRNTITFMLLSARNEGGGSPPASAIPAATIAPMTKKAPAHKMHATPAQSLPTHPAVDSNNPGTPNPNAGFLGFQGK